MTDSTDKRADTSPENGKKGGRPPAPPPCRTAAQYMAECLLDARGLKTARHWKDGWYTYSAAGWEPTPDGEMVKRVISWLQTKPPKLASCASINYSRNVLANLSSFGLCGIEASHPFPCFISSKADARNWMAFSNCLCVDVWKYASDMAAGADIQVAASASSRALSPDFFSTDFVPYAIEPDAPPPDMFTAYLRRVAPDPQTFTAILRMMGLLMADCAKYEVFFQLYGKGANGKTVLLDIIEALVGRQNTSRVPLESLAPGTRFQSFPLILSKVNISGELRTDIGAGNLAAAEGEFKHAVSGGTIEVERKGVDKTFGRCRARFVMSANSLPTFVDKSDAIWRRLRIIPFDVQIPESERDPDLSARIIRSELPGIANLAIEGLACIIRDGAVAECARGTAIKSEHRSNCDHERDFLTEKYAKGGPDDKVAGRDIYEAYKSWMIANGYRALGSARFNSRVEDIIPTAKHGTIRTLDGTPKGFTGIKPAEDVLRMLRVDN